MSFADLNVTHFPPGLNNLNPGDIFTNLKNSDPTKYHQYFEDFDYYAAANWTITVVQAGSGSASEALTNVDGGVLLITNDNADDDSVFYNKVGEGWLMEAGKKAFFRARLKVSDATQSDVLVGLQITDTTPLDATDGIYFYKADGSTSVSVFCRKDATTGSTTAVATTMADDTFIVLEWYYDGVDRLYYGSNGTILGFLDASSSFLPDHTLTVSFGVQNGEAVIKTLSVDYIFVAKER